MEIKKDGFLCKTAYSDKEAPESVSVCKLFWRFIGNVISDYFAFPVLVVIFSIILYPIGFLFGYKCTFVQDVVFDEKPGEAFTKFEKWPTMGGYRILPIPVTLLAGAMVIIYSYVNLKNAQLVYGYFVSLAQSNQVVAITIPAVILFIFGIIKLRKTEFWQLTKEYAKATKNKVCPIIKIVE